MGFKWVPLLLATVAVLCAATTAQVSTSSATTQSAVSSSVTTQFAGSSSVTTQPAVSSSVTTQPAVSSSVTTQPAVSSSVTTQPAVSSSATTQPAVSSSATTQPAVSSSVTTQPAVSSSVTTQPAGSSSVTTQPAGSPSATTQPAVSSLATTQPAGTSPATEKPGTSKPTVPVKETTTKAPPPTEKPEPAKPTKIVAFSLSLEGDYAGVQGNETRLKEEWKTELRQLYEQQPGFKDIIILGFSNGSIVVRYMAIFEGDDAPSDLEIEQEAEKIIQLGNFSIGGYDAKADSLIPIEPTPEEIATAAQGGLCSPTCGEFGACNVTTLYGNLVAQCVCKNDNYCSNGGTCNFDGGPKCRCDDDPTGFYMGDRCEFYASQPLVIGLGAGVGGLLLIIIITLSVCLCCRRKKESDFERPLTPENGYWSPDEKVPMTKDTQDINDEMPLYSMVNKRQTYSDNSSGSERNNLARASRLSSQDNGNSYVTPSRERSSNDSFLHGNLRTFGGHDNRAYDWAPSLENVPVDQKFKLPRARVSTSNNQW